MTLRGLSVLVFGISLVCVGIGTAQEVPSPFKALPAPDVPLRFKPLLMPQVPDAVIPLSPSDEPGTMKSFPAPTGTSALNPLPGQDLPVAIKSIPVPDAYRQPPPRMRVMLWPNETLAQGIARTMRECGQLSRFRVNVQNQDGVIDLVGEVSDESQRAIVIHIARSGPGVVMVRDWLQVTPPNPVVLAQAPVIQPLPLPLPQPLPGGNDANKGMQIPDRLDGQLPDPTPIFQMPLGPNPAMQPPPLPPYAWPTYAPYNNYSRVAYPLAYPYEQWPFIGPMYPFPRVPLGWRSVTLSWEDGHWWFNRNPTGHDWWRIRYW